MLTFWELTPSPNNIKIRMALRFKGIPFESVPIDAVDRSSVREVSGQDLTPVIRSNGTVVVESEAILHYLDANHRESPRLFPQDRDGRRACDIWRKRIDETVAAHWYPVFAYALKRRDSLDEEAQALFRESLIDLDEEIGDRTSFHDDPEMAICDLRVAEWAIYALPGQPLTDRVRLFRRFRELFAVDPDQVPNLRRFLAPWQQRLG